MKPLPAFLFLVTLLLSVEVSAQVCTGDFYFQSQAEVDQFIIDNPSCTSIEGELIINNRIWSLNLPPNN